VRWCILERTRESACEPALYCVVMHCSACFRDRRNTRALHLSRCQASQAMSPSYSDPLIALSYPLRYRTVVLSSRMYILYNLPASTSYHQLHWQLYPVHSCVGILYRSVSIMHTYASYPHALAVVFWSPRRGVSARFHHTFPLVPKNSFMQVHKKLHPSHLYDMHYGPLAY